MMMMMMSQEFKYRARPIGTITRCNAHAKLHGQSRYEWLDVTFDHVWIWTMGDASGGESDEGLRPRSKTAAGLQMEVSAWRWLEQVSPG